MLHELFAELGIGAGRSLMIGDTTHEIGMAQAAGAASLAVLYGAHDPEALRAIGPDAIVASVPELADWLAGACDLSRAMLGPQSAAR